MTPQDARRAGRALYEVTQEAGTARLTLDGLTAFAALVEQHADLGKALLSPFVTGDAKRGIVGQLSTALGIGPAAGHTLQLIAERHQMDGLAGIVKELKAQVHKQERRVDAEVTTAVALDAAQIDQLREVLSQATGQQVTLSARVDPAVIGGALTRVGSVVYDGTIARQLACIKEQFVQQG